MQHSKSPTNGSISVAQGLDGVYPLSPVVSRQWSVASAQWSGLNKYFFYCKWLIQYCIQYGTVDYNLG